MQENNLFEYAVIRVVPRVEREEFLNVGVVVYCAKQKFLKATVALSVKKLEALCPGIDIDFISSHLNAFEAIANGAEDVGPIGLLDNPSRFRWLTATRSTVIQCAKVHPGFCSDPAVVLEMLMQEQVY